MDWQPFVLIVLTVIVTAAAQQLVKMPGRYDRSVRERIRLELSRDQAERTVAAKDAELATAHALIAEQQKEIFALERRLVRYEGMEAAT